MEKPLQTLKLFNLFFTNVRPTLASKIKNTKNAHKKCFNQQNTTFKFKGRTQNEILEFVSQLKSKMSAGPDGTKILKVIATSIKELLSHFINISLHTRFILVQHKIHTPKTKPLHKSGDKDHSQIIDQYPFLMQYPSC